MTAADSPASPYRRILVPMDGSRQSDRALQEAIALARAQGGVLRLLGILDESRFVNGFEPALVVIDDVLPRARREMGAMLEAARSQAAAQGVDAAVEVLEDDVLTIPQIVTAQAAQWPADLVVVGTHGRGGIERLLSGSVAESILRDCPVPVLLVKTSDEVDEPVAAS
jgi:nucleotide-binding universal stress UspA family protein